MKSPQPQSNGHAAAADETTPLIAAVETESALQADVKAVAPMKPSATPTDHREDDKPLPKLQIFLVCYARMMEPIAFFCIFPFVNQMIKDTGNIKEEEVGFYSGWIESLFSLTQMVVMIPYGRLADRVGRKPVLVWSLCGCSIAMACFGLSKHIWQMILFRCFAGAFAGTVITARSMITELSTPRTQARAFSFFAIASYLGIFLGPLLGGFLADPANQFPSLFEGVPFFEQYPYALPTLSIGCFGASAAVISALFVKETLQRTHNAESEPEGPMSTLDLLKSPGVGSVIFIYSVNMVIALAYTAVCPVFWFTSPSLGGFGLSPYQISLLLAANGLAQAAWLLLAFPPLQHRFGTGGVLRGCAYASPFLYILCPALNALLRFGHTTAFWIVGPTFLCLGSGVAMSFTAIQLALNDISPSPTTLGTINAIALALTSGIRAVAPALFASIFAAGVERQILWGYLIWVVLVGFAAIYTITIRWLPAKAEGKLQHRPEEDADGEEEEQF